MSLPRLHSPWARSISCFRKVNSFLCRRFPSRKPPPPLRSINVFPAAGAAWRATTSIAGARSFPARQRSRLSHIKTPGWHSNELLVRSGYSRGVKSSVRNCQQSWKTTQRGSFLPPRILSRTELSRRGVSPALAHVWHPNQRKRGWFPNCTANVQTGKPQNRSEASVRSQERGALRSV